MSSWLSTSPSSKLLILAGQEEFDPKNIIVPELEKRFGIGRINYTDSIDVDEDNVPFIDDWFLKGFDSSDTDLVCWINADIIVPNGWYQRIKFITNFFREQSKQVAIINRRCDFNNKHNNGFEWPVDFDKIAINRTSHSPWGVDSYVISKSPMSLNPEEIPPFHMGKYRWDPWITGWLNNNIDLISLGNSFCTYHVNHIPKPRNMEDVKVKENFEMAARNGNYNNANHHSAYTLNGDLLLKGKKVVAKMSGSITPGNMPLDNE